MPDPAFLPYITTLTNVVSASVAVTGAVLTYRNYRKAADLKALELRLDLRRKYAHFRDLFEGPSKLIDPAQKSRERTEAMKGTYGSSHRLEWNRGVEADRAAVRSLAEELPAPVGEYRRLPHRQLEDALVAIDNLTRRTTTIADKYKATLVEDDKDREFHREQVHRRVGGS